MDAGARMRTLYTTIHGKRFSWLRRVIWMCRSNGQKQHAGPGFLIFLASNDAHNLQNTKARRQLRITSSISTRIAFTLLSTSRLPNRPCRACSTDHHQLRPSACGPQHRPALASASLARQRLPSSGSRAYHHTQRGPETSRYDRLGEMRSPSSKSGQVEVTVNGIASRKNEGSIWHSGPERQAHHQEHRREASRLSGCKGHVGQDAKISWRASE